jgi:hypothetical protein
MTLKTEKIVIVFQDGRLPGQMIIKSFLFERGGNDGR